MNVEQRIKKDISVAIEKFLINNLPGYRGEGILDDEKYEKNFFALMNVLEKNVIAVPRKVHYSQELNEKIKNEFSPELCDLIKLFETKFSKGENIKGYLSIKAFDADFKDILFNHWNIKHLHLIRKEAKNIKEMENNRSDYLLFCIIHDQDVYFLDVRKHPKGSGFTAFEFLNIIYNNKWMDMIGAHKVEEVIEVYPKINSDDDIFELYKNNINCSMFMFHGECYMIGFGVSCAGNKTEHTLQLCTMNKRISKISRTYGDKYRGFELTLDGHLGNIILEGEANKISI